MVEPTVLAMTARRSCLRCVGVRQNRRCMGRR